MPWIFDPDSNDDIIPLSAYAKIRAQADAYANSQSWGSSYKLQLRFRQEFCYIDSVEKDETVSRLGRLRYFGVNKWSFALFTYSNERYEPCLLPKGEFGSLKECIDVCAFYLV